MLIIDNTKPPAPILEWKPTPTFVAPLEERRYREKEKEKWLNGILDIPGTLYHRTQEQHIKNRITGETERPICRDGDMLVHTNMKECRANGEALIVIKGRGFGLSSEMGCMANYFMKVFPGTTSLLTSQELAKIETLFSEKVAFTYDNYDDEIRPIEINRNQTKNYCYLKTKDTKETKSTSQIICRETSDKPKSASAFSGTGAIFGAYDELFLHKRYKELVRSSMSCFVDPKTKKVSGFLLCGGTVEDTLSNADVFALQTMIEKVQKTGMLETMPARVLFIPCWYGYNMTNGWSDEKGGIEWWNKSMDRLMEIGDVDAIRAFRMNNPLTLEDVFQLTSGARFSDTVSDKIRVQIKTVRDENPKILPCRLVDMGAMAQTIDSTKPHIWIYERPKPNVEYIQLIDGVGIGKEQAGEKGISKVASMTMKMYDPAGGSYSPVAILYDKPDMVPDIYPHLISQLKLYNQFGHFRGITWEHAQGITDHFGSHLKKEGMLNYVIKRRDISGKGNIDENKMGQTVTIDARKFQYRAANDFLNKYIGNIKMLMLLEQMLLPMEENADILDAFLLFFSAMPLDFDKPVAPPKVRMPRLIRTYANENGRTVIKWVEA